MEYRKLISFGKSSFVVSLPKSWLNQNKLKKGDVIYIDEIGQNLLLSGNEAKEDEEDKVKVINIDGKPLSLIIREVNSSYILNYRTIILKGKEIKSEIKQLQQVFQNLIALEIMEQTSDSIIAKDFLNMNQVSINELIHKMDIITRTMLKESCNNIFKDNYENINERDKDVNRLYFLLDRVIMYNLNHLSNAMKKFKVGPIDLLNYLFAGFYIEGIADEARRTARYSRLLKINAKDKNVLNSFFNKVNQYYLDTMKAFYDLDHELALKLSCLKKELNDEIDLLEKKNKDADFVKMTTRVRRMLSYIHSLGRIVYQGLYYSKIVK